MRELVRQYGTKKWSLIASKLEGRLGKQCRERWYNHLDPEIKKDPWTDEEDRLVIELHAKLGNRWAEIAKHLDGRYGPASRCPLVPFFCGSTHSASATRSAVECAGVLRHVSTM